MTHTHIYIISRLFYSEISERLLGMYTAPIPALAPVMRTVLPSNLEALKMDIDEQVIEFNDNDQMDNLNAAMFAGASLVKFIVPALIQSGILF